MLKTRLLHGWLRLTALLPLPVAHAIGTAVGVLMYLAARRTRRVVEDNIRICFPSDPPATRARLVRNSLIELGRQVMEAGIVWYASPRRLDRLVRNPEVIRDLEACWPPGRGLLVAAPHLGNWELCSLFLNRHHRVHNLYRPPRQPWLEPLLVELRERTGARSLPADASGLRFLLRSLRQGRLVGILPDQIPDQSGVHAPFFGVPALTMTLFSQMARKTEAGMVFFFSERLPRGQGFRLHVLPGDPAITDPDPVVAATALNRSVEACVLRAPAQYQWTYRRFRAQPDGRDSPYRRPRRAGGRRGGTRRRHRPETR